MISLKKHFEEEENFLFDPSKFDFECPEKEKISEAVSKHLKKITDISNANFIKNADGLLSRRNVNEEVEWISKDKKRLPDNRYKISY